MSIQFSEMDIIDDINESNFGGVRGSNAKLRSPEKQFEESGCRGEDKRTQYLKRKGDSLSCF